MKQQDKQPSNPLIVFSVIFLSYTAMIPIIEHLFNVPISLTLVVILGFVSIVGSLEIWINGYLRVPKIEKIFLLVGLLSMVVHIYYFVNQQKEVTTSTVSREVNAKVVTEYSFSSNFKVVLIAGDDVIPVEDVKNWRDFPIGTEVTSIEKVTETTTVTDVFGRGGTYDTEYVILKGKE